MNAIKNKWARLFISLVIGSLIRELVLMAGSDPNRPETGLDRIEVFFYASGVFVILSFFNDRFGKKV
jgi:hypothetical protein